MSFASATQRFNARASALRTASFSGAVTVDGYNLQIGTAKFLAPCTPPRTTRTIDEQGIQLSNQAVAHIPKSLNLTLAPEVEVTHLPTGDKFHVVEISTPRLADYVRVTLRKLEK